MALKINNNLALARQFFEYLNEHEVSNLECFWGRSHRFYFPNNCSADIEEHKELITLFINGFPDFKNSIFDEICEGNKVVLRGRLKGTHKGMFLGLKPTNNEISINWIDILEFSNGKILNEWLILDTFKLMRQIGGLSIQEQETML
jgi:predicted ester cyclase